MLASFHCAAPQTDVEPRYPETDPTRQPFGLSLAAWYTNVIPVIWPWDANNTLTLSSLGRNWYTVIIRKMNVGRTY